MDIEEFFYKLNVFDGRIPLDKLTSRLKVLNINFEDVKDYAHFSDKTYQRNSWVKGNAYHALVLCWKNGQRSPIHDHEGSSCAVRVLKGVATETFFGKNKNGLIYATGSAERFTGSVTGSEDDDIHQISNLQEGGRNLVTLHIYSPPLLSMNIYSLTSDRVKKFEDPIYEFSRGEGI